MKHTAYMGLPGKLTLPVELPSVAPEVPDNSQIFDAGAGRRYGVYNSTLPRLRSWSWSQKVLSNKIVQNFYPLTSPVLTAQPWFMLPCGYGVNWLSPTDSSLLGSPRVKTHDQHLIMPERTGGGQLDTFLYGVNNSTAIPVFQRVPVPVGALGESDTIAAGFWGITASDAGNSSKFLLTVTLEFQDGSTKQILEPAETHDFKLYVPLEVRVPGAVGGGKKVAFISLAVTGVGTIARPYLMLKDPNNVKGEVPWTPGVGAYSVAVKHSSIWRYSQYASYLDLELVELSQTFVQR